MGWPRPLIDVVGGGEDASDASFAMADGLAAVITAQGSPLHTTPLQRH